MNDTDNPTSDTGLNFRIEIKPKQVGRRDNHGHGFPHEDFVLLDGFTWEVLVTGAISCTFNGGGETFVQASEACTEAIAQAKALAREVAKP